MNRLGPTRNAGFFVKQPRGVADRNADIARFAMQPLDMRDGVPADRPAVTRPELGAFQQREIRITEYAAIEINVENGGARAEADAPIAAASLSEVSLILFGEKTIPDTTHHESPISV